MTCCTEQVAIYPINPKRPEENIFVWFNPRRWLRTGESVIATPVVTSVLESGADASPAAMISGVALLQAPKWRQKIIGGVAGATYLLNGAFDTSLGRHLVLVGRLHILTC